jgi:hypothetical protein
MPSQLPLGQRPSQHVDRARPDAGDRRRRRFWPPRDARLVMLESVDQGGPIGGGDVT